MLCKAWALVCGVLAVAGCHRPLLFDAPAPGAVRLFVEQAQNYTYSHYADAVHGHWSTEDIVRAIHGRASCVGARVRPAASPGAARFVARFEGSSFVLSESGGDVLLVNQTWLLRHAVDDICEAIAAAMESGDAAEEA